MNGLNALGAIGLSPASLLGLTSPDEDLESLSTEELRYIHACEYQRLGLTQTVGTAGGVLGALVTGKFLLR